MIIASPQQNLHEIYNIVLPLLFTRTALMISQSILGMRRNNASEEDGRVTGKIRPEKYAW
jgi:hypothetical protein